MSEETWVRSSFCDAGACVEVLFDDDLVFVRNSVEGQAAQMFSLEEWRAFIEGVRQGEFDA